MPCRQRNGLNFGGRRERTGMNKTDSFSSAIKRVIPFTILVEVFTNLVALTLPVLLINASAHNMWYFIGAGLLSIYLYSFVYLLVGTSVLCFLPKAKVGKISSSRDHILCMMYQSIWQMITRNKVSAVLRDATPMPGWIFYRIAGLKMPPSVVISEGAFITDPYLVEIGENSIIGLSSGIVSHLMPAVGTTILNKVVIGKNVVIGFGSVVYAGAVIGDGSQIQAMSLVKPNAVIPPNEVWGGRPAVKIRDTDGSDRLAMLRGMLPPKIDGSGAGAAPHKEQASPPKSASELM